MTAALAGTVAHDTMHAVTEITVKVDRRQTPARRRDCRRPPDPNTE
jgi:hypothetical protein